MGKLRCNCGSSKSYVENKRTTLTINGESMFIDGQVRKCSDCNEVVKDPVLDSKVGQAIKRGNYTSFTVKPKDVAQFRRKYKITREDLSKATGYQSNQIRLFERGKEAQPEQFRRMLTELMQVGKNKSEVH